MRKVVFSDPIKFIIGFDERSEIYTPVKQRVQENGQDETFNKGHAS